jgi:hypothetical protein
MIQLKEVRAEYYLLLLMLVAACAGKPEPPEQLSLRNTVTGDTVLANAIDGTLTPDQILTTPHRVVLTGMVNHRLITIYKQGFEKRITEYNSYENYDPWYSDHQHHYMPGIDLISGYNLLNVGHYDMTTEKLNLLFSKPALVKSIYYPSFIQDSLKEKPINRNYYLISVYDEDTNRDSLIDNRDLRRFYQYPDSGIQPSQLIPPDYSVLRSQYDSGNDVMYIFARHDRNANGRAENNEPVHVFWIDLAKPTIAKRMY